MIEVFRESFYSLWFQNIPDKIIESAIREVCGFSEVVIITNQCPRLADEYIILKTVMFINTFMGLGKGFTLTLPEDESDPSSETVDIEFDSLTTSGNQSFIKKDSIDSSLSREYFKPTIPEGMEAGDFPLGNIKERIAKIDDVCKKANSVIGGVSSRVPMGTCGDSSLSDKRGTGCGLGHRQVCKNATPYKKC